MHRLLCALFVIAALGTGPVRSAIAQFHSANDSKSPRAAFRWSLGATVIPAAAGVVLLMINSEISDAKLSPMAGGGDIAPGLFPLTVGVLFGPSAGHFYSGRSGRALGGIALRTAVVAGAFTLAFATTGCPGGDCYDDEEARAGRTFLLGGAAATVLAALDIARAPASARASNEARFGLQVIPGRQALSLALQAKF